MGISVCMIVKNEEKYLEQCLNSIKELVDEIIIVDTGSTDRTKEIAARFTNKIFDFQWCDDFAAARNESLKHATGDWILALDADEIIEKSDFSKIIEAISSEQNFAFSLPQLHYTNEFTTHPDFVPTSHNPLSLNFKGFYSVQVIRLFKRIPSIFFDYCVHETVLPSLEKQGIIIPDLMVPIHHYHELKGVGDVKKTQEFYFRLSLKNIEKYPHYAKSYNDVGVYYANYLQDQEKALIYCQKAVELEPGTISYVLNLSYRLRDLNKFQEAIMVLKKTNQNDIRVLRALGYLYLQLNKLNDAINAYQEAYGIFPTIQIDQLLTSLKQLKEKRK